MDEYCVNETIVMATNCVAKLETGDEAQSNVGLRGVLAGRCQIFARRCSVSMDAQVWAKEQFGQCDLKDKRRTQRLTELAARVLCHPSGSLPEQTTDMADLKAAVWM